jgi:hypothetical protein
VAPARDGYRLAARAPTAEEYRRICTAVGWEPVMNFAAAGTEQFYRRFGFEAHPGLTGMFRTIPRRD